MEKGSIVLSPQEMQVLSRLLVLGRLYFKQEDELDEIGGLPVKTMRSWQDKLRSAEESVSKQLSQAASEYVIQNDERPHFYALARYGFMDYLNGIGEPCSQREWEDLKKSQMFGEMITSSLKVLLLLAPDNKDKWLKKQIF